MGPIRQRVCARPPKGTALKVAGEKRRGKEISKTFGVVLRSLSQLGNARNACMFAEGEGSISKCNTFICNGLTR